VDATTIGLLLVLGTVTGFMAGLLGIGGGMIMVPFLVMILTAREFPADSIIKVAIATSLTTIIFTSISSVRAHHSRGAVRWDIVKALAPGVVIGTLLGAQVVGALPGRLIAAFFAAFIGWSAWKMLRPRKTTGKDGQPRALPSAGGLFATGGLIGVLSAFLGAGGGFLTIPFLTNRNVRIQQAIASSAACGFPIALSGTIGYIIAGWNVDLPDHTFGYLYLPALAVITPASVLMAPLGARAAHALSVERMRLVFALLLVGLSGYMLTRAIGRG
jgi:uncharacterized membrane protein YfcA